MHIKEDMLYNGTVLEWYGFGTFRATSGLPGHQNAAEQAHPDEGPIPEGLYSFPLKLARDAAMIGPGQLDRPARGSSTSRSTFGLVAKTTRTSPGAPSASRLTVIQIQDPRNRHRGGFYLHDSTKGYSHGCIKLDPHFFLRLRAPTSACQPQNEAAVPCST